MAARSNVRPAVDCNVVGGACARGPGLPTWKEYWPAWLVVVDDPRAALRKKIAARATIATAATITAITPGLSPRLFRGTPLSEGVAFFPLSLYFVFVLNWLLLLHGLECFCFDRFVRCSCLPLLLAAVHSPSYLPECVPGKSSHEDEKDECACPVWNPGKGIGHDPADVLQREEQAYLPVGKWRHGTVDHSDPQHPSCNHAA